MGAPPSPRALAARRRRLFSATAAGAAVALLLVATLDLWRPRTEHRVPEAADNAGIPKIYHTMWLGDDSLPEAHQAWVGTCRTHLSERHGWEHRVWNMSQVEELIAQHRPSFLPTWRAYPKQIQRADSGRYVVLQIFGGLYLDTDVECFRELSDTLAGFDMVVQEDFPGDAVNSGAIATRPNHPAWEVAFQLIEERKDHHDQNDIGFITGPQIVRDTLLKWHNIALGDNGLLPPVLEHPSGLVTRVYPLGSWCTPCGHSDNNCHEQFMLQRVVGSVNLTQVVAYHRFTATWLGFKDGLRPQAADTVQAMFCKSCEEELKQCRGNATATA